MNAIDELKHTMKTDDESKSRDDVRTVREKSGDPSDNVWPPNAAGIISTLLLFLYIL